MPYVEGESLRDRLEREKQLPVDDALCSRMRECTGRCRWCGNDAKTTAAGCSTRDTATPRHRDTLHVEMAGHVGAPNRWITLRALRVLEWYSRAA